MKRAGLVLLVAAGAGLAWVLTRKTETGRKVGETVKTAATKTGDFLAASFNFVRGSNMRLVTPEIVRHPNVRAFLMVIRQGESRLDDIAYRMICGKKGAQFASFADHPRPVLPKPCSKGASGAYQFTIETWDWVAGIMGLRDFSPASQDRGAVGLIAYRGALPAVMAGDLKTAFEKLRPIWTSLPGAAENQFTTAGGARLIFAQFGGVATA